MSKDWLKYIIEKDVESGTISGYVTNARENVQLKNYLEDQDRVKAINLIKEKYKVIAILKNMWVEEDDRGNGIGKELLNNFINDAEVKGAEAIVLVADTGETNEFNLIEWYEEYGFEIIYQESDSYPVMVKEL